MSDPDQQTYTHNFTVNKRISCRDMLEKANITAVATTGGLKGKSSTIELVQFESKNVVTYTLQKFTSTGIGFTLILQVH